MTFGRRRMPTSPGYLAAIPLLPSGKSPLALDSVEPPEETAALDRLPPVAPSHRRFREAPVLQLPAGRAARVRGGSPVWLPVELLVDPQALDEAKDQCDRIVSSRASVHQHSPLCSTVDRQPGPRSPVAIGVNQHRFAGIRPVCSEPQESSYWWWPLSSSKRAVLVAQRRADQARPLAWEFPGGKVEPGDHPARPWWREIEEELACSIEVGAVVDVVFFVYDP